MDVLDELTCTAFNSLDLQQLEKNSFSKTLDQVVSGHFSFTEIGIQGKESGKQKEKCHPIVLLFLLDR